MTLFFSRYSTVRWCLTAYFCQVPNRCWNMLIVIKYCTYLVTRWLCYWVSETLLSGQSTTYYLKRLVTFFTIDQSDKEENISTPSLLTIRNNFVCHFYDNPFNSLTLLWSISLQKSLVGDLLSLLSIFRLCDRKNPPGCLNRSILKVFLQYQFYWLQTKIISKAAWKKKNKTKLS